MDDAEKAAHELLKKWGYGVNGSDAGKVRELAQVIRATHVKLQYIEASQKATDDAPAV